MPLSDSIGCPRVIKKLSNDVSETESLILFPLGSRFFFLNFGYVLLPRFDLVIIAPCKYVSESYKTISQMGSTYIQEGVNKT